MLQAVEIVAVVFSLAFLILLMRQNIWCWLFGIISSLLSVYLFAHEEVRLYSEAGLYSFYVLMGFYGWWIWRKEVANKTADGEIANLVIRQKSLTYHLPLFFLGVVGAYLLGLFFQTQTDAERTYIDAASSVFGIVATFLEAHRILTAWLYWIVLNGISIWLYYDRGLPIYAVLMVAYFVLSIVGYRKWSLQAKG